MFIWVSLHRNRSAFFEIPKKFVSEAVYCKLFSFFRFTKIVKMKKKQQEKRKEGSGRGKIEREKGQEGGGKEGEKDGVERREGETEAEGEN